MNKTIVFMLLALALCLSACEEDNTVPNPGFSVGTAQQDFINGVPTAPPRRDPGISYPRFTTTECMAL